MTELAHHTRIEEYQREYQELKTALRAVAEEHHSATTEERPRLLNLYQSHFGQLEAERQKLALDAAEIFRRVELLSIKVSRGEELTDEVIDLINKVVDKEYEKFKQRVKDAFDTSAVAREQEARQRVAEADDEELLSMYRTLAKQLHPDSSTEPENSIAAWHRVKEAYTHRNAEQLRLLLTMYSEGESEEQGESWDVERWEREVNQLSSRLRLQERSLERLRSQEPFTIAEDLSNESWVKRHLADLQSDVDTRHREIEQNIERYRELTGGRVAPGTKLGSTKEEEKFEEDFMENTYFGGR